MLAPLKVAVAEPVPPWATARVPLEIFEAFRLVMFAPLNVAVADPVPPLATGRMELLAAAIEVPSAITTRDVG